MTSFLPDTRSEPLLKVLHRTLQHFFFLRQSCDFLTNGNFQLFVTSGSSKCFNQSEYSVSIWNCTSTLNIELLMEKTDSNYGITVSKKTARRQTHDTLRSNAPWLLKLHCLSCPQAHAQRHQPHPCRVLAI